jgi:phospholipid/cholesterol/gamma-HCH transport system substrate-binding protein
MNKEAPTLGRLLTMVFFALSCFGLLLFLWLSFGGPTPLKPKGYQVKVAFPEATQLGLEADVRVAGVKVGSIRKKEIDPDTPNRTLATLELDRRFAPLNQDARAILRQKTLLGETYVELTPGNPGGPKVPEGGKLSGDQVSQTVQLDEVFQALDPVTRESFRTWQRDLGKGINGRGKDLNDAFGSLPQFVASGTDLLEVVGSQDDAVRALIRNTGVVFGALTEKEDQLANLITNSGEVFQTTSDRQEALAETIRVFPTFLDESKATFARLEKFAIDTEPLIRDLQPVTRDLRPTLRDLRALAPDLERFFRNLDPLITVSKTGLPALSQTLDGLGPVLAQLQPFLEQLNPVLDWLEYHQRTVANFITNGAAGLADTVGTATEAERGHYLRQFGPGGMEALGVFRDRPAVDRGNAYPLPASSSGEKHAKLMMFGNHDCDNTGEPGSGEYKTKMPDQQDKPSCFITAAPQVPAGNTRKVPHITAADYSK